MERNYGEKVYSKNPLSYNLFAGYHFYDNWFTEFGYEFTRTKRRTNTLVEGEYLPGVIPLNAGEYSTLETKLNLQHPTLYLGYNFSLENYIPKAQVSLAAGFSWTKLKAQQEVIDDELPGLPAQADIDASRRTFTKKKLVPAVRISGQYDLTDHFALRCSATWRQLSRIQPKSEERPNTATQLKLKNSTVFGFGLTYTL